MGKTLTTIIELKGNIDSSLSQAFSTLSQQTEKLSSDLSRLNNSQSSGLLSGLKDGLGTLASAGFNAAKDLAVSSFDVGKNFQAGMSEVKAISGASAKDMVLLTDKAKEMGETTSFSASDAADALKYMAMAGWQTNDMLDGIQPILNLAQASALDLGTTSDIVTDALTAFGMTAQDTRHFTDVLAMTSSKANTNVSMLGETFKNVAPLAGALGYTVDDVSVGLGLMANSGIKGGSAGTQLRSALANLAKPTDEVSKAMQTLGISLTDSSGEMKPFQQTLTEMRSAFAGLSEAEKSQYASTIAGKQGMSGFLAMMNASEADVRKLTKAIEECDGAAEDMAATMTDNLAGDLAALGSKWEAFELQIFDVMEPLARFGTQTLTNNVVPALMETVKPMSDLALYMKALKDQATDGGEGPLSDYLSKSITTDLDTLQSRYEMLQTIMGNCKQAWSEFSSGFESTGAMSAVKQAINDVCDSFLKVSGVMSGEAANGARSFGEALGTIVKSGAQVVSWFANLNASTNGMAGNLAIGTLALAKFSGGFSNLVPTVTGVLGKMGSLLAKPFSVLNPFKGLSKQAKSETDQATSTTTSFSSKVAQIFQSIGQGISTAFQGIGTGISTALQGASTAISSLDMGGVLAFSVGLAAVTTAFIALAACKDIVLPFLEGLSTVIGSFISGIGQTFVSLLVQLAPVAVTLAEAFAALSPIIEAVGMAIGLAAPAFEAIGTAIGTVVESIGSAIAQVITAVTPLVEVIGNIFLQIAPVVAEAIATIIEAVGPFIPSITDLVSTVTPLISELIQAFVEMSAQISPILESLGNLFEDFGSGLKSALEGASEVIDSLGGAIKNTLDGLANVIESIGKSALNCGKGFDKMADGIVKITSLNLLDMGASLGAVAAGATAIGASSGGMAKVGEGFLQLAQGLMMIVSCSEGVKQAMADLPATFENLSQSTDKLSEIGDKFAPVAQDLSQGLAEITTALTDGSSQITNALQSLTTGTQAAFTAFSSAVQSASSSISSSIFSLITSFTMLGSSTTQAISGFTMFQSVAQKIPSSISAIITALNTISPATTSASQAMQNMGTTTSTVFSKITADISTNLAQSAASVATHSNAMASSFRAGLNSMLASTSILNSVSARVAAAMAGIATAVRTAMSRAVAEVQSGVAQMRSALSVTLQGPQLAVPHVSISGSFSLNPPSAPSFSVSYYKEGGILTGATLFGMLGETGMVGGEAGPEAVLPLSELWSHMESILTKAIQAVATYRDDKRNEALHHPETVFVSQPATSQSSINVTFAPVINITGSQSQTSESAISSALSKAKDELLDELEDLLREREERSFGLCLG